MKNHENLLWLLSTNDYGGGELLEIPRTVAMKLMEDGDFDHLFDREEDSEIPSRNELQRAIHRNANLAVQIAIVGSILQEADVDVIEDSCGKDIVAENSRIHCSKLSYCINRIGFLSTEVNHTNFPTKPGEAGHALQEGLRCKESHCGMTGKNAA